MRIDSSIILSSLRPLALGLSALLASGCLPQPATTPDAEASAQGAAPVAPAPPSPEEAAQSVARQRAQTWLQLVDGGQYDASWDAAAVIFQSSTTKEQWNTALQRARGALGALSSRELQASEYKTAVEGAPEGKYVVVYYTSAFAEKPSAREIVTLRQATDESWKVAGYFVQ